jgi:hypothetical protein
VSSVRLGHRRSGIPAFALLLQLLHLRLLRLQFQLPPPNMASKSFVKIAAKGDFVREVSLFRNWIQRGSSDARFPAGALIVPSTRCVVLAVALT